MGVNMSQILQNLYVGSLQNASDLDQLRKHSITHIVSIYENPKPLNKTCQFLCISARDDDRENLIHHFSKANDFIHEGRLNGAVLIHCAMGVSRSVTLSVAYIMTVTGLSFEQALRVVQHSRTIANPNEGFKKQLRKFGKPENLDREIHRFRQKYDKNHDRFDDLAECKRILAEAEAHEKEQ